MTDTGDETKLCFVVSPIGATGSPERTHADWLLQGIIDPVFKAHFTDFRVERADKITAPGMIDSQVINRLLDAELVIADMSLLNANAFYEMGIRHMKQKPIIHMYQETLKIPFDVAPHRAIPFSYAHPNGLLTAQAALKAAVEEVIKPDFQVENPVTRARGVLHFEEHAMPELKVIAEDIQALRNRMDRLEVGAELRGRGNSPLRNPGYGGTLDPRSIPRVLDIVTNPLDPDSQGNLINEITKHIREPLNVTILSPDRLRVEFIANNRDVIYIKDSFSRLANVLEVDQI